MDILDFLLSFSSTTLYFIGFGILLACGMGLPIPEDITLLFGGWSAYFGLTSLWGVMGVALSGVILGDSLIFFLGAKYGRRLTRKWFFHKLLPDDRLNDVREKFHKKGNKLIFVARFMPGFRAAVFFSAGTLHLPYRVFLFYDGLAALLSVPAIVSAAYFFGDEFDKVKRIIQRIEHGIVYVVVAIVLAVLAKWYITHRHLKRN